MSVQFPKMVTWVLALTMACFGAQGHAAEYSLSEAVRKAQAGDPWLDGSRFREENLRSLSVSAGTLPDPTVSLGVANLPTDSFNFGQEPMTQLKVGVSQMFPRGNTRSLRQEKLERLSRIQPFAREDRKASVAVIVSHLWLEARRSQQTVGLIEKDRGLFEHLVDVAQSGYATAFARTRQQDLVRAQLELTRLEDRLTQLHQQRDIQFARLGEWLSDPDISISDTSDANSSISLLYPDLLGRTNAGKNSQRLVVLLNSHPKLRGIDQKISAMNSSIRLAEQSYKPQWGVNASYGYRDQDPFGNDRPGFFSVGVNFDVPLFTSRHQDKQVQAATADKEAVKTDRVLMLRQLKAGFDSAQAQYLRLLERKKLFDTRLLREMYEQAEASLTAYSNGDGDFAEAVRARIAELNARVEALNVHVDIQKSVAQLNYFLTGMPAGTQFGVSGSFSSK